MAFKQRSAFKVKEGGTAFKQMGSSEPSPMKLFGGLKKAWGGIKKIARNTPIGLGIRALRGDFKKGGGGSGSGLDPESMSYDDARSQLEGKLGGGLFGGGAGSSMFGGGGGSGFMGLGLQNQFHQKNRSILIDKLLAKKGFSNPTADTGSDVSSDPGAELRAAERARRG